FFAVNKCSSPENRSRFDKSNGAGPARPTRQSPVGEGNQGPKKRAKHRVPMFFQIKMRRLLPEWMDQPGLEVAHHVQALRGLERINSWSGSSSIFWPALRSLALSLAPQPVRVLDLATGGGDVAIRLWRKAYRSRLAVEISGCDRSETAVEHAR